MQDQIENVRSFFSRVDNRFGGVINIIGDAAKNYSKVRGSEAAASIAYYAIFSLFPLLLALVTLGSYFLDEAIVRQELTGWVEGAFPASQELIIGNIESLLNQRGAAGLVAIMGLLWSATGVFFNLIKNINRAWPEADLRSFVKRRLFALAMVGVLFVLLVLSWLTKSTSSIITHFELPMPDFINLAGMPLLSLILAIGNQLLVFLIFYGLYWWVPNTKVNGWAAFWGALAGIISWEVTRRGFLWYMKTGTTRYALVHGSLGAIIIMMFWIYISASIILFGAHLTSAIAHRNKSKNLKGDAL